LTEALVKLNQMPLAFFPSDKNSSNENVFCIYIRMTGTYFILLQYLKLKFVVEDRLLIKLPVHPSTIDELALIRFWLLKLSQTHFEELHAYTNRAILNPEFLSVLNPRTGPMKIMFHANNVEVGDHETAILANFAQFICAQQITLHTSFPDEPHRNNLFRFIMGTGKKVLIFTRGSNKTEFCEFLVKVNFDHRSFLTLFPNLMI
jgi:hypothetical protein